MDAPNKPIFEGKHYKKSCMSDSIKSSNPERIEIIQPKVATQELPWVCVPNIPEP
jgi:hypothetical protein